MFLVLDVIFNFSFDCGIVGIFCCLMHTLSASKQGLKLIPLDLELEKTAREKKKQTVISRQSPSKMDLGDDANNDPPRQQVFHNPQNGQRTM